MLRGRLSELLELGRAAFLGSTSVGFALFANDEGAEAVTILRKADASIYAVKKDLGA